MNFLLETAMIVSAFSFAVGAPSDFPIKGISMANLQQDIGRGRTKLRLEVMMVGDDVVVLVNGGEFHVGSVAIGLPRPSLEDPGRVSSTTSIFNIVGHKDDFLAKPLADELAAETERTIVVVAGFHLPGITPTEINEVLENVKTASHFLKKAIAVKDKL